MPVELAELAAGLPIAASFAMAGGISVLREGRRRTALNEAVHELRRPLQAATLSVSAAGDRGEALESSLRMAAAAVDRLDYEINRRPAPGSAEVAPLHRVVESAVERWRVRASLEGRAVSLRWEAGDSYLHGDVVELMQVVDNLISNGLDHGSGEVTVVARRVGRFIRLGVLNGERAKPARSRWWPESLYARISGRRRHGHGLRIVRRVAVRRGGSFRLRQRGNGCEAVLELPLSGGPR